MISKLKKKFILLATASTVILMVLLVGIMNIINYSSVTAESDAVLDVLSQADLSFGAQSFPESPAQDFKDFMPRGMSPEVPYESRYFTAVLSNDGTVGEIDVSRIISVDRDAVVSYVQKAAASSRARGFIGQFRYAKQSDGKMTQLIFLDCGRKLDSFRSFLRTSMAVGLFGCLLVFVIFLFAAGRIVRPIAESYGKQKRFVTDAGHEIKTPLAIIGANLDLLESDCGENESIAEVRAQTNRLAALTNDLVYLSKMEEAENELTKIGFPVSDTVVETAQSFRAIAQSKKIDYRVIAEPGIMMYGAPDAVRQLVSILLDNAMKYAPEGGSVMLGLRRQKKVLQLSVMNTTAAPVSRDDLDRLFDRFYRADASRNSETGGNGIGLSIAQAIVLAHNGKISAESHSGTDFTIQVIMPL